MLIINECGFSTAPHEKMKKAIEALIGRSRRSYLIVPEQQTVTAESEMACELPECAPLHFEVTNFTRLSDSVFRIKGGVCKKQADGAARSLIMWRTLTELSVALDMTRGRSDINDGLVKKALSAISELNAGGVDADELAALSACDDIGGRLKGKISDISMISALFRDLLERTYGEREDALARCYKMLTENRELFSDAVFFIEGFTSFTEPQYRILGELMKRCEVNLLLPLPKYEAEGFEFSEIRHTKSRISALADKFGVEKKLVRELGFDQSRPEILNSALRLLWRTDGEIDNDCLQNQETIRIFEAHTPFDECDFIAADIKRRIMGGDSYSDFAIIARSPEEYLGVLDVALEKSAIPYFMSRTHDATEYEAIKFIYSAYSAADSFRREDVISYIKCGFCDVEREVADEFEMYVERWQLGGGALISDEPWNMNPDGYTLRKREDTDIELQRINETRTLVMRPLVAFSKRISGTHTVKEHAEMLFDFLTEMNIEEQLELRPAVSRAPLWQIITEALDTVVDALGDMSVSKDVFLSQLKILFRSVGIGKIPAVIDEVTVGGAEMLRLYGKRHIYLLGVNGGKFPKNPKDESYFSEKDKLALSAHGINLSADLDLRSARELFFFSRAFGFAEGDVTLLYSVSGTDFKTLPRSDIISRFSDISHGIIVPKKIAALPPSERIYSPTAAAELIGELSPSEASALERALSDNGLAPYPKEKREVENGELSLGEESLREIYHGELALTQTRIDSYVKCPLSYFCKYNLDLSDSAPFEVGHSGIGSFVHAILENFFSRINREEIDVSVLSDGELEKLTYDSAEKYTGELYSQVSNTAQTKIMLERVYRATLPIVKDICTELAGSGFKPKFFELNIRSGSSENPEPVRFEYPEGAVSVYGQIDRVDTYRNGDDLYVKVIDYKTGNKRFSPKDLEEGENLQMFLYLKSIIDSKSPSFKKRIGADENTNLIPAGVIYVKTSPSDIKVSQNTPEAVAAELKHSRSRQGMILNTPDSLAAENRDFLPVRFKTDGAPTKDTEKYLYTLDGWDELMNTLEDTVGRVSGRMRRGEIPAAAKGQKGDKLPCEYCEYRAVCRKSVK